MMAEGRWIDAKQAADYSGKSAETIRVALRRRELKGAQPKANASWRTKEAWVDAWLAGEKVAA
jgi:hypothetical protein